MLVVWAPAEARTPGRRWMHQAWSQETQWCHHHPQDLQRKRRNHQPAMGVIWVQWRPPDPQIHVYLEPQNMTYLEIRSLQM